MKTKNIILCIIFLVVSMLNSDKACKKYDNLEINGIFSVKKDDLPQDFSENALKIVNEFIQKTQNLDKEWAIYFDYKTGEILKCGHGEENNVKITFREDDFDGHNVASIHNHTKELLSAPSHKNFRIFERKFEDYELIAGFEHFWILKAKGLYENLVDEANSTSEIIALTSLMTCTLKYNDDDIINQMHGKELSKYINNKNINDIQLLQKEYTTMDSDLKTAEFSCLKRISSPDAIRLAREYEKCPFTPTAKEILYNYYQSIGVEIEFDEIFAD